MTEHEEWRAVEGWPYEVSSLGHVRRTSRGRGARPGRIMTAGIGHHGYPVVKLSGGKTPDGKQRSRTVRVHTLVAVAFIGPREPGHEVNHIDGDKTNNRRRNLEYVPGRENMLHAYSIGLIDNRGERHPSAKLTASDVRLIRALHTPERGSVKRLARRFGLASSTVSNILRGVSWRSVA